MTASPVETPALIPIAREVRLAAQSLARHVKDHTPSLAPHLFTVLAVSYTHLTLPTIYSV